MLKKAASPLCQWDWVSRASAPFCSNKCFLLFITVKNYFNLQLALFLHCKHGFINCRGGELSFLSRFCGWSNN